MVGYNKDQKDRRVLVIDDEESNVEALLDYFQKCNIECDFENSLYSAAELIYQKQEQGKPYSLIISDNHFVETGLENIESRLDGIDFLNILLGKERFLRKGHHRVAEEIFGERYEEIKQEYQGKVMMFSGSALADSQRNPALYSDIDIAQKIPDGYGACCCEAHLVPILEEKGFACNNDVHEISDYKKSHHLEDGLSDGFKLEELEHEKRVREFLDSCGEYEDPDSYAGCVDEHIESLDKMREDTLDNIVDEYE